MTTPLALLLLLLTAPAFANPMLDKCLPFAPAVCGLKDKSAGDDFLACFETVKLDAKKAPEAACAEELTHARVHKDCAADIAKFCSKVKPGENRTMDCLRKNAKKTAPACRKALTDYDAINPTRGGQKRKRGGSAVSAVRC